MGTIKVITFEFVQVFLIVRKKNVTDWNDHFQALDMSEMKPEFLSTFKSK